MKKQTVDNQDVFLGYVALLIRHARSQGYQITLGDGYRDPRAIFPYSSPNSYHAKRLAIDFNLFLDGKQLKKTEDFEFLGRFWKSLDPYCTWGGDFPSDGNHFSFLEGI